MNNTEYNQYLVKKAQQGLVRFQRMQKRGFLEESTDTFLQEPKAPSLDTPEPVKDYMDVVKTPIQHNPAVVQGHVNGDLDIAPEESPVVASESKASNPYLRYAIGGAGAGALIGALINLVRKKSLLSGALSGALVGGGLGAGHKYLTDNNETYGNWKNNPIESGFQSGFKAYDDLLSKFNS